jgi:Secretion system C-terminal sorting domain
MQFGINQKTEANELSITILQNPIVDETDILLSDTPLSIKGNFQLFDLNGRVVLSQNFEGNRFVLQKNDLAAGLYILKIRTQEGQMGVKKIVLL